MLNVVESHVVKAQALVQVTVKGALIYKGGLTELSVAIKEKDVSVYSVLVFITKVLLVIEVKTEELTPVV
jgi:hypothetical protein